MVKDQAVENHILGRAGQILLLVTMLCLIWPVNFAWAKGGSKQVTDAFGRIVDVPLKVERLVALGSSMAFVTYLGAQNLAVGVEDIEKTSLTKPYAMINKELVKDLPIVCKGGAVRIPDYERILSLKPDIVFILSVDSGEPDLVQRKLGIPVVAVSQGFPNFDEEVFLASIILTGEVLDRQSRAQELVQGVRALADEFHYRPDSADQAKAYVGGLSYKGHQGINSSTGKFFPFALAQIANVVDVTGRSGHCFVEKEFLLGANPSLIFVDGNGLPLIAENLKIDPGYYTRLQALRTGQAWLTLPHTSYFSNPELFYINAFFMAKVAYPEHYPDLDPVAKADEIFTLFNGTPLYDQYAQFSVRFSALALDQEHDGTWQISLVD